MRERWMPCDDIITVIELKFNKICSLGPDGGPCNNSLDSVASGYWWWQGKP